MMGPFLPKPVEDLGADCVLAETAYYHRANFKVVKFIEAKTVMAYNPRGVSARKSSVEAAED